METRQQRLIREALEHDSKKRDEESVPEATLRDKSLAHTDPGYVPRTLTPHEWEAYYETHGVPNAHRNRQTPARSSDTGSNRSLGGFLSRFLRVFRR